MTTARAQQASALLQNIQRAQSGRLTVFLGAAPGVGKTYAMLSRAHELLAQGMDVCIAVVESHGRADTEKLIAGIPRIPVKMLMHQGRELAEMDIDAVLQRKPAVVLVDELAHRNIPNSRHERRWQDVNELLDAGIDVMTTMNVQHLESLNDVVLQITGVRVSETVPDRVFDRIRDIRLIDLPVSELIERLKQGKVYQSEHADMALQHFFSVDNLTALRELAVQCVAEQVDDDLRQRYAARGQLGVALKPQLLLAIDGNAQAEALVRQACRVAERLNAEWTVVYVQNQPHQHLSHNHATNAATPISTSISTTSTPKTKLNQTQKAVDSAFQLARQLGARTEMLYGQDVAQVLLDVVSDRAITTLMLGQSDRRKWQQYLRPSFATRVLLHAPQVDVHIVPRQNPKQNLKPSKSQSTQQTATDFSAWLLSWQDMLVAFVVSTLATGVSALGERVLDIQDLSVIYIVAVLLVAAKSHWRRAVFTAVLCFVAYNFFFIDPRYTLQISAHQGVVTVLAFLASALIASRLASQLRLQVLSLQAANRYTQTMQDLARELASAPDLKQVMLVGQQCLQQRFAAQVWLKVGDEIAQHIAVQMNEKEQIAYAWCLQHQQACGRYTDTLSQIRYWFIPLQSKSQCVGVVGIAFEKAASTLPFALKQHIEAIVEYIAQAVERTLLVLQLEQAKVSTETEKLRSALLSSVSHDLRSPLAAMMGSADTLLHYHAALAESDRVELLDSIRQEGQRLDRYIQNLLDMTRLGHNGLSLKREWIAAQDLVASATQRLQRYLPQLKLSVKMPEQAILIYVHPALIEQALFNVLENAAHFSPAHEVVTLQMQQIEDNRLQFRIEDRGVGIPEAEREQIFDMFYTMQRGDRGQSGTGLGLTIVKAIVAAHMGEIRASAGSQQQGTMITINLPIHPAGTQSE